MQSGTENVKHSVLKFFSTESVVSVNFSYFSLHVSKSIKHFESMGKNIKTRHCFSWYGEKNHSYGEKEQQELMHSFMQGKVRGTGNN